MPDGGTVFEPSCSTVTLSGRRAVARHVAPPLVRALTRPFRDSRIDTNRVGKTNPLPLGCAVGGGGAVVGAGGWVGATVGGAVGAGWTGAWVAGAWVLVGACAAAGACVAAGGWAAAVGSGVAVTVSAAVGEGVAEALGVAACVAAGTVAVRWVGDGSLVRCDVGG